MSEIVTNPDEVPAAWGYVLCDDNFMSGWGLAEGKINVCIFPVDSSRESDIVFKNCQWRTEMKKVRFRQTKPAVTPSRVYSLFSKEDSPRFYEIDGFHPANRED